MRLSVLVSVLFLTLTELLLLRSIAEKTQKENLLSRKRQKQSNSPTRHEARKQQNEPLQKYPFTGQASRFLQSSGLQISFKFTPQVSFPRDEHQHSSSSQLQISAGTGHVPMLSANEGLSLASSVSVKSLRLVWHRAFQLKAYTYTTYLMARFVCVITA